MIRFTTIALMIAAVLVISSCGGGSSAQSPPPLVSVVVTPATTTVFQGATATFKARVTGLDDQAVTWSIADGGMGTIDSNGIYTAPQDTFGGPFFVVATSHAVPNAKGTAAVTVSPPKVTISPATVTLSPSGAQTFTATVGGLTDTTVTWTVQEAGGGAINGAGFYTAPLTQGFYHVVATSVADPTVSTSAIIAVTSSSARFTPTGNMQVARVVHTATLLGDGRVLMAGSRIRVSKFCDGGVSSAELYDLAKDTFAPTGTMTAPRYDHTATVLQNGKVLVTGGFGIDGDCEDDGLPVLNNADLYDPSTGVFKATSNNMVSAHQGHTATLLSSGKVLIVGGGDGVNPGSKTAELYDPGAGLFTATGSMATPRVDQSATLLVNGKVLIVGGVDTTNLNSPKPTASAELYDPATGSFSPTNSMGAARDGHSATVLADGRVLMTGGTNDLSAEVYDPVSGFFSPTGNMLRPRMNHTATLLSNGDVLVAGGSNSDGVEPTAELYDPITGSFSPAASMETGRSSHTATLLQNGAVLVAGDGSTAELYH
jgi:hypothetical protein